MRPDPTPVATEPVFAAPAGGMSVLIDRLVAALAATRASRSRPVLAVERLADGDGVRRHHRRAGDGAAPRPDRAGGRRACWTTSRSPPSCSRRSPTVATTARQLLRSPDERLPRASRRGSHRHRHVASSSKWAPPRQRSGHLAGLRRPLPPIDSPIEMTDDDVLTAHRDATSGQPWASRRHRSEDRITRYRDAFPQYRVGHLDRIASMEATLLERGPDCWPCAGWPTAALASRRASAKPAAAAALAAGSGSTPRDPMLTAGRTAGLRSGLASWPGCARASRCHRGAGGHSLSSASRCGRCCSPGGRRDNDSGPA